MIAIDEYNRWLNSSKVSNKDKIILRQMDQPTIDDAFFKNIEFGTGGMRGILGPGTNRLNEFTIRKATIGFAIYLLNKYKDVKNEGIVISHDNRFMSREFTLLCAKILSEFGIKTYIFNSLRPTPELSFAVRYVKASGGIMITASHNPKEYNGYKLYDEKGCQLVPEQINALIEIIKNLPNELDVTYTPVNTPAQIIVFDDEIDNAYVKSVESIVLNSSLDKKGFKIVFTPNHGTSYVNGIRIFNELGFEVYPLLKQCNPDPNFSETLSPNPEDPRSFIEPIKFAKEIGADLIVMTDPDGDRCGVGYLSSDGTYKTLTGNQSGALLMDYIFSQRKAKGLLSDNGVMFNTIVTSSLGKEIANFYNVKCEQFLTGFKYIGNRIGYYEDLENSPTFEFGYEESYGCLIAPFVRDKDALQAITMYCEMALFYFRNGKRLDEAWNELGTRFGFYEDLLYSTEFKGSMGYETMNNLIDKIRINPFIEINSIKVVRVDDYLKSISIANNITQKINLPKTNFIKLYFEDKTTISIRPSGTEPKIKIYVGVVDKNQNSAQIKAKDLYDSFANIIGLNVD